MHEGKAMYRVGYPFWRSVAKLGMPLKVRVRVIHDDEAGVFVATSDDIRGLVAEAPTMDELIAEIRSVVADLMADNLHTPPARTPTPELRLCVA